MRVPKRLQLYPVPDDLRHCVVNERDVTRILPCLNQVNSHFIVNISADAKLRCTQLNIFFLILFWHLCGKDWLHKHQLSSIIDLSQLVNN